MKVSLDSFFCSLWREEYEKGYGLHVCLQNKRCSLWKFFSWIEQLQFPFKFTTTFLLCLFQIFRTVVIIWQKDNYKLLHTYIHSSMKMDKSNTLFEKYFFYKWLYDMRQSALRPVVSTSSKSRSSYDLFFSNVNGDSQCVLL